VVWSRIGIATSLLITGIAIVTLLRFLHDVDPEKVVAALLAIPRQKVFFAGIFVAIVYVTLTLYDFFSLRTIGRREVPYRIAALAGFTSYSIGHALGATVFTGGAVRLRIYSAWGLSILEVAKVAFVTGLTFWLGNAFILSLSMTFSPEAAGAINQLPSWLNRVLALIGLATIIAYVAWLIPRPRVIGRAQWQITLPNAFLTLAQIGIGVMDLSAGALAIYMLLPSTPALDFLTVLVTYVMASVLGFLSHAPGSLGVFELALLVGLSQFEKEDLLGSLLIFRTLYFIVPFATALVVLGTREVWLGAGAATSLQRCNRGPAA